VVDDEFCFCLQPSVVIPDEYPRWGSFIILADQSLKNQTKLLEDLSARDDLNEDERKLALVWRASMKRFDDWVQGKGSTKPVEDELEELRDAIGPDVAGDKFVTNLAKYFAHCQEVGIRRPLSFDKEGNLEDSKNEILDLSPSGLSLPSRDYYLEEKFAEHRDWFQIHLDNIASIIGGEKLEPDFAERVIRFETKLAQITMKKDQSRQFDKYYSLTTIDVVVSNLNEHRFLEEKLANFAEHKGGSGDEDIIKKENVKVSDAELEDVKKFVETMTKELKLVEAMEANYANNYPDADPKEAENARHRMMIFDGDYFRRIFKLMFRESNQADLRAYMQYKVIRSGSDYCTKALNEEVFDFFGRKLRGQKEQKTPEKRSVNLVNAWVDMLMGKVYVKHFFTEEAKTTVQEMIEGALGIVEASLKRNDWLTEDTKQNALRKLAAFSTKIGYPEKWKDFSALKFEEGDSLFSMARKVQAFEHKTEFIDKINSVKDTSKWEMPPSMVNAYFHPLLNEICFPAAIIQPPFYNFKFSDIDFELPEKRPKNVDEELIRTAANYGGIGAVIFHECTHSYDDQGSKFDWEGNVKNWWTDEDQQLFKEKQSIIAKQVKSYKYIETPEDGEDPKEHTMSAELTMGENLADLGGLSLGYQALMKNLQDQNVTDDASTTYLADCFFRSWANIWKSKESAQFAIQALSSDPHAPPSFRANLVKNLDAFHKVYGIKPSEQMFLPPEDRLRMW